MNTQKQVSPALARVSKKHLVHLISSLGNGGCENMLLNILPALDQFRHTILTIKSSGPLAPRFSVKNINVICINIKTPFDPTGYRRLFRSLRTLNPDILTTYLPYADLVGRVLGRLAKIPVIVCSVRAKLINTPLAPFFFADGLTSPLVSHYHFNSRVVAHLYRKYLFLPSHKMTVIPNSIDLTQYSPKPPRQSTPIFIGCVAQLRRQKGHRYLIPAFAQLLLKHPHTTLVLVGEGKQKKHIAELIKRHKVQHHVMMLGDRQDIPKLLSLFDIFVLPTLYEGMSRALLEAMASHCPIVTTDIAENRELLKSGRSALLVPPRDVNALTQALEQLICYPHLRSSLGEKAYLEAKKHDLSHAAKRLTKLYQSLM